ncbi:helix-turn-helix domain-containing protein [Nocardiopsis alkaliphila]|uniref:helix-turn-helix domain-containing protein n=1 Tax=Nocardiopsis alkaliphila TaxID=225762 RepID=UPI00034BCDF3|nr:helix-turn-helix transcriptional regulator [Nocardiopsis alkaliphila]
MRTVGYHWHLRELMAQRGMFHTSDLVPHLAERGIEMSSSQVHRLVSGVPERLTLKVFAALCDILQIEPGELFEPYAVERSRRKVVGIEPPPAPSGGESPARRPRRARILPEDP